jgi:hypothetical protein
VSEISGSWIDGFSAQRRLLWSFRAPVSYPSDPQWLGGGHILLADYASPGHALIVDTRGHVLWRYGPASGPGALDHPSLAVRIRPGLIGVTDDYRHRVVLIDLRRHRIVWQYGHTDVKGTAPGYLNTPDGMDLLPFRRALAIPATRRLVQVQPARRARRRVGTAKPALAIRVAAFHLPAAVQRAVAVGEGGRILIAGGLDSANRSAAGVFSLDPARGRLQALGSVPLAFHDAAAALAGGRLLVFGGGSAAGTNAVQAFDLRSRRGSIVGRLPRALSDLAAARVGSAIYLVGGFDGRIPRAEILSTSDGTRFATVAKLPEGLRYPAVATSGGRLLVAGGQTATGLSSDVFAFDPASGRVARIARLPAPRAHAAAVMSGGTLYVIGGRTVSGRASDAVTAIDLRSGAVRSSRLPSAAIADTAVASLGSSTYLVGGWRDRALDTVLLIRR